MGPNVIAIDVLIEPDATMMITAKNVNARLRRNHPDGFAFDATHVPHITLVQRFVRATDLDALASKLSRAVQSEPSFPMELRAIGYESSESAGTRVLVCIVDGSPGLLELAARVTDAVQPYAVSGGSADAFFKAPDERIEATTVQYVEDFVPAHAGPRYEPHVTFGRARPDFVQGLLREPFEPFAFNGDNLAIHHLGNAGTARKRLWSLRQ